MKHHRSPAFTLVELLVVIAIIGILVALLLPAVQAAREAARRMSCTNNEKQLALAVHNYHDTFKAFVPGSIRWSGPGITSWQTQHTNWISRILPFVEQQTIYDQIDFWDTRPWNSDPAKPGYLLRKTKIPTVRCPSDAAGNTRYGSDNAAPTNYVGCSGGGDGNTTNGGGRFNVAGAKFWWGIFQENSENTFGSVQDGTSNTLFIGECMVGEPFICRSQCGTNVWPQPTCYTGTDGLTLTSDNEQGRGESWFRGYGGQRWAFNTIFPPNDRFTANHECMTGSTRGAYTSRSRHPGGVNMSLADGSVTFISDSINLWIWRAASTMDGSQDARQPTGGLNQ